MEAITSIGLFAATAVLFIMTPGIDTVFVLNKSISQGKKAGIFATLGINGGIMVHTILAAMGFSMLVAKSATAFMIIKYIGAAYLVYLGVMKLISKEKLNLTTTIEEEKSNTEHFFSGLITNVLNPKVALFFLSFFPQFIKPEAMQEATPFIILGMTYTLIGIIWFVVLTYVSQAFSSKMKTNEKFNNWLNKISGAVYILMGIKVALTKK